MQAPPTTDVHEPNYGTCTFDELRNVHRPQGYAEKDSKSAPETRMLTTDRGAHDEKLSRFEQLRLSFVMDKEVAKRSSRRRGLASIKGTFLVGLRIRMPRFPGSEQFSILPA